MLSKKVKQRIRDNKYMRHYAVDPRFDGLRAELAAMGVRRNFTGKDDRAMGGRRSFTTDLTLADLRAVGKPIRPATEDGKKNSGPVAYMKQFSEQLNVPDQSTTRSY